MKYVERPPPAALAKFVECLWVVRAPIARRKRPPERILPDGCPEWIIHAGDPFERFKGGSWTPQPASFLAATLSRPWQVRGGRRIRTLGIRFRPGAVAVLLDLDLSGTADSELDLAPALGAAAAGLAQAVRRARTTTGMLDAAQEGLLTLAKPRLQQSPWTRAAVDALRRCQGQLRIAALASLLGVPRRRLERAFRRELGISPKRYARILRLNVVLASVVAVERAHITQLALDAGYFDEAHLLRDFRALAGRRPRNSRRSDGEMSQHFTRPERLRTLLLGD